MNREIYIHALSGAIVLDVSVSHSQVNNVTYADLPPHYATVSSSEHSPDASSCEAVSTDSIFL